MNITGNKAGSDAIRDDLRALCVRKNALDYKLYDAVKQRLLSAFEARYGQADLEEFARRCDRLRDDPGIHEVRVTIPQDWLRLDS
jgi:hypothetical protein